MWTMHMQCQWQNALSDEMQTNLYDLHTDGTSRDKKSYVGQQVTLENKKSLSCSFQSLS